ncbi:MAG: S41 family peptidase [Anaerolineae bacterium]
MSVGEFLKSVVKLWVMAMLAAVLMIAAFGTGYFLRASYPLGPGTLESAVAPTQSRVEDERQPAEFAVFWEAWQFIEQRFYGEIPPVQERVYGAIRGMVNAFGDPNTAFIDPTRAEIFRQDTSGSFEGIGAAVRIDQMGHLVIVEPYPGRPAAEAGLRRGDIILEIDGTSTEGMSLYEAISLIRGPANTKVTLTIFREGVEKPFDVTVTRARIEIKVVEAKRLDGNLGYVSLSEFSRGAADKIARAIKTLQSEGPLEGLILDLRNNPGGLLDEAIAVGSQFIADGVITIEREKGGTEQVFETLPDGVATDIPLVVLINQGSASAAEIVAGAIQDYKRGTVVGEQSFGKGTVQIPHTLSDGSELRVTIAEWLTPKGRQINGNGIAPDIVVERTQEDFEADRDPQLERAVEILLQREL